MIVSPRLSSPEPFFWGISFRMIRRIHSPESKVQRNAGLNRTFMDTFHSGSRRKTSDQISCAIQGIPTCRLTQAFIQRCLVRKKLDMTQHAVGEVVHSAFDV